MTGDAEFTVGLIIGGSLAVAALAGAVWFVVFGWHEKKPWPIVAQREARRAAKERRAAVTTALTYGEAHDA